MAVGDRPRNRFGLPGDLTCGGVIPRSRNGFRHRGQRSSPIIGFGNGGRDLACCGGIPRSSGRFGHCVQRPIAITRVGDRSRNRFGLSGDLTSGYVISRSRNGFGHRGQRPSLTVEIGDRRGDLACGSVIPCSC